MNQSSHKGKKMKILYYTGTGNSYLAAKDVGIALNTEKPERLNRNYLNNNKKIDSEKLVIVFPLYYGGLPGMVLEFFKKIDTTDVKEVIAIITRGDSYGIVDRQIIPFIQDKLKGLYYITMPSNYVILYNTLENEESINILKIYKFEIKKIIDRIVDNNHKVDQTIDLYRILGRLFQLFFRFKLKSTDKRFHVTDKCNNCDICSKVCTNNNITLENKKPLWNGKCEECMACIHLCPQRAIQYGRGTYSRRRYINPEVPLKVLADNS